METEGKVGGVSVFREEEEEEGGGGGRPGWLRGRVVVEESWILTGFQQHRFTSGRTNIVLNNTFRNCVRTNCRCPKTVSGQTDIMLNNALKTVSGQTNTMLNNAFENCIGDKQTSC